jgi:hypothetical protein
VPLDHGAARGANAHAGRAAARLAPAGTLSPPIARPAREDVVAA